MTLSEITALVKDVPNFPSKGILFKDITPILENNRAFSALIQLMGKEVPRSVNKVLAIESRGFILGAALAQHLGVGMVIVRKPGKLPRETVSCCYDLEYGSDALEVHADALASGEKVLIIDDVLATGGTAGAAEKLCQQIGAEVIGHQFLIEIEGLEGRKKLKAPVTSFIRC